MPRRLSVAPLCRNGMFDQEQDAVFDFNLFIQSAHFLTPLLGSHQK